MILRVVLRVVLTIFVKSLGKMQLIWSRTRLHGSCLIIFIQYMMKYLWHILSYRGYKCNRRI